jgi:2-C-methyl-D-erythritol 4-phosphate cytidylyltransferase
MPKQMLSVIVAAAGKGSRFGGIVPKQFKKINNIPVYIYSLLSIKKLKNVDEIFLLINKSIKKESLYIQLKKYGLGNVKIVYGSSSRAKSVHKAFKEIRKVRNLVVIHDSVRPNFNFNLINKIIKNIDSYDGIILGSRVADTVKKAKEKVVGKTLDRNNLWIAQTPQIFKYEVLYKCYSSKINFESFTDESQLLEMNHFKVKIYENFEYNNKITTEKDLSIYKRLLENV